MKELFQDIHIDSIMTFLRQINLFNKIYLLFLKSCFILHLYQTIIHNVVFCSVKEHVQLSE